MNILPAHKFKFAYQIFLEAVPESSPVATEAVEAEPPALSVTIEESSDGLHPSHTAVVFFVSRLVNYL